MNKRALEKIFETHGFSDFKWLDPGEIETGQWVRMKCRFGCDEYGRKACCPPNMPDFDECQRFFGDYGHAAVFHFEKKYKGEDEKWKWYKDVSTRLLAVERDVFLQSHYKAFVLFMSSCPACAECVPSADDCRHPEKSRPTPEALFMDVYKTIRKIGFKIEVVKDRSEPMNRYAFLFVE